MTPAPADPFPAASPLPPALLAFIEAMARADAEADYEAALAETAEAAA